MPRHHGHESRRAYGRDDAPLPAIDVGAFIGRSLYDIEPNDGRCKALHSII